MLGVSLVANVVLGWALWSRPAPEVDVEARSRVGGRQGEAAGGLGAMEREWRAIAEGDPKAVRDWLRALGASDEIVREVVGSLVYRRFAERQKWAMLKGGKSEWWRRGNPRFDDNDALDQVHREWRAAVVALVGERAPALEPERERLLRFLPEGKVRMIARIESDYRELTDGLMGYWIPADRERAEFLEAEMARDIEQLLTPTELEEYRFRTDPTVEQLMLSYAEYDVTEAQFRALCAMQAEYDAKEALRPGGSRRIIDPFAPAPEATMEQLVFDAELREWRAAEEERVLGAEVLRRGRRALDEGFREIRTLVKRAGGARSEAERLYDLRFRAAEEGAAVAQMPISVEAKRAALAKVADRVEADLRSSLGAEVAAAVVSAYSFQWLSAMREGSVIRFDEYGRAAAAALDDD